MSIGTYNSQLLVRSQLPDFIASDYPKFVEFLKAYYTFVHNNYDINVEDLRDADNTSSALLVFLRRELMKNFPTAAINERKLITTIRDLYNRKGNLDSIRLLFRLFFNDAIIIYQPGSRILKASDGKWSQYNMITLSQIDWESVISDMKRAASGDTEYVALFNTIVSTYKVGDVNRDGNVTLEDAEILSRFTTNPQNTTLIQRTHIEDILIPTLQTNAAFSKYIFSNLSLNTIVPNVSRLVIENRFGRFTPTVEIVEVEENKKLRFFYKTYTNLKVETGQIVRVTGADGSITFTGRHVKAQSGLRIVNPGRGWQKGQIFNIQGSVKDTTAKVVEVGPLGELRKIEILEYGFSHDENLSVIVSPYPIKPSNNSSFNINTTITGLNPSPGVPYAYNHVMTLSDYTEGVQESVYGQKNLIDYNVLVSELINAANNVEPTKTLFDIVYLGYKIGDITHSGTVTLADSRIVSLYITNPSSILPQYKNHIETILIPKLKDLVENVNPSSPPSYITPLLKIVNPFTPVISSSTTETTSVKYNFSELTFEEWAESRSTLAFESSDIVKTKGVYLNDESLVSNNEARLQDNYFFQLFSYMIETTKDASEVSNILNQFHPAGMKYFFQKNKKNFYSVRDLVESYRALSTDVVFARDVTSNFDVITKTVIKPREDFVNEFIEALANTVIKPIIEPNVTVSDAWSLDQDPIKFVFKPIFEEVEAVNVPIKNFIKDKEAENGDAITASVSELLKVNDKSAAETIATESLPSKILTKYTEQDAASMNEGSLLSVDVSGYAADDYYNVNQGTDNYSQIAITAEIG